MLLKHFIVVFTILYSSYGLSTPDSPSYVAGVVEFNPRVFKYFNDTSIDDYLKIIHSTEAANVDILIFPELTLNTFFTTTYVPESREKIVPCENIYYEDFLSQISCAARSARKYIVVNVVEKANCTAQLQQSIGDSRPCSPNGLSIYNTNVVFDRNGTVTSRYRKWNLYGEPGKNTTYKPDYGTFDTDFGVRFGHFICFDILFYTPVQELVQQGITDFIFPSMWFSELPFLSAVQIQSAWAYANNVNLLASGANKASVGSTGTGIYAGTKGPIVAAMRSDEIKQLYVAIVPKKGSNITFAKPSANYVGSEDLFFKRDFVDVYNTSIINPAEQGINRTLCHDGLCCKFNVWTQHNNASNTSSQYTYRMAVYNGTRTYGVDGVEGNLKICGIMSCLNDSLASCGMVYKNNIIAENTFLFEKIEIEGSFASPYKMLLMPNSLDFTYMPLNVDEFEFLNHNMNDHSHVKFTLTKPRSNLLTFAIYGNVMDKKNGAGVGAAVNVFILISLKMLLYLFS